ncbi:class I SAM-dependent methyltransferase [bacterium]|nr:class I SAM-dependent methyltransferase [bacterium]
MDKDEVIRFYSEYSSQFEEKIGSLDIYHESYNDFICGAKRKSNMLDLACGPGNVSLFIKNMCPEIEITCVDLSDEMLELAKKKGFMAEFYKSDILNIDIPDKKYDLIMCAFGIPYIKSSELERFVSEVNRYSEKGTSVYISCMEGEFIENEIMSFADFHTVSVQRHRKINIVNSFEEFQFKLTNFNTQAYREPNGFETTDMFFSFEKV